MSNVNLQSQRATAPTLFVTKGRQRVKQYDNNVIYLKNGDEFEFELFNPTSFKVLAKISLNGKYLGEGLVLRPGERVFLERYFDEARKFLFETYEVDGNDSNVKKAIEENGKVEVEFYAEYQPSFYSPTYTYYPQEPWWYWNPTHIYVYSSHTGGYVNPSTTVNYSNNSTLTTSNTKFADGYTFTSYSSGENISYMSNSVNENLNDVKAGYASIAPIETGRVEKGSNSDQSFKYDNTSFNSWYTWKTEWKILPESRKGVVKEDLVVYCSNCGAKRKKSSFVFCPHCGTKF